MSANVAPIFTRQPNVGSCLVLAANTRSDGVGTIGTDIFLAFTADVSGSFVSKIRWNLVGTVADTTSNATVGRLFISTKSTGAVTSSNCYLWQEFTLPSLTADSSTTQSNFFDVSLNIMIPSGSTILATNHAAPAANTFWRATVIGGDY